MRQSGQRTLGQTTRWRQYETEQLRGREDLWQLAAEKVVRDQEKLQVGQTAERRRKRSRERVVAQRQHPKRDEIACAGSKHNILDAGA